ncbi:MAG: hypothetical protein ACI8PZ_002697 [Myxococcota bacterium]|jgi:hypothetical protein
MRVVLVLAGLAACGGGDKDAETGPGGTTPGTGSATGGGGGGGGTPASPFGTEVAEIRIEIDYQPGAEPYTGAVGLSSSDVWTLFDTNASALFPTTPVVVPHTLDGMEALPAAGTDQFDVDAILALADAHWQDTGDATSFTYYALWLDGTFVDSEGANRNDVLGVSIGNTRVLAMFKPVIESVGVIPATRQFGEQAVLIHEFGHAVGLVDNGVEMVEPHRDDEHGDHCNVDDCVMYWALEGGSELAAFVLDRITGGDEVLFDDLCLQDAAAARE